MNNDRRKKIKKIIIDMESIKALLEDVLVDEESSFDNMPEGLQYSEKGEASQEAIDLMNEAVEGFEEVIDNLNSIT